MSGGKISLPDDGNLNDGPLPLLAFLISPVHAPQNGKAKGTHRRCGQAPPAHGQTEATTAKKRCGHGATSLVGRPRLRRAELSFGSAHCSRSVAASCIAALAATAPPGDLGRPNALLLRRHEARACDILLRSSCSCSVVIEHAKPTTDSSSGFTRCNAIFSQPSEQSAVLGSRRLLPCRRWHGFVLPRSRQSSIRRPLIDLTNSLRRTRPPPGVTELSFVQPVVRIRIGNSCRP